MSPGHILVVDDEKSMRDFLSIFLRKQGYLVDCADNGKQALEQIRSKNLDLVITDIRMPEMDGMQLLHEVKQTRPDLEFIVMTAFSSTADAIHSMKMGAYDYITKPFKLEDIKVTIDRAMQQLMQKKGRGNESEKPEKEIEVKEIIGNSQPIRKIFDMIKRVAGTNANILITGESGTGKELVARAIHFNSHRRENPFVTVNCGAIPSELMESELFGHMKGSFTGSIRDKEGLFKLAHEGTLFLDEVSELNLQLQVKLLRAIQERKIMPVGGSGEINVNVRILAATNRDLKHEVNAQNFREDLFYRLNVIQIQMPALRQRREDIPLLVNHFVKRSCRELGREVLRVSEAAMMLLANYDYPGNVRELSNIIERAVALESSDQIRPQSLPPAMLESVEKETAEPISRRELTGDRIDADNGASLDTILEQHERRYIEAALKKTGGVKTEAAKELGISFRSLRYRLQKLGMDAGEE